MEFEKICKIISEQLLIDPGGITEETSFTEDLGADTLDVFQILTCLSQFFYLELGDHEIRETKTVGDAVRLIIKNP